MEKNNIKYDVLSMSDTDEFRQSELKLRESLIKEILSQVKGTTIYYKVENNKQHEQVVIMSTDKARVVESDLIQTFGEQCLYWEPKADCVNGFDTTAFGYNPSDVEDIIKTYCPNAKPSNFDGSDVDDDDDYDLL